MPFACAGGIKYAWMDHDPAYLNEVAVKDMWYEVAHIYDFRELLFAVQYDDEEHTRPTFQVKWTIDGNVYFVEFADEEPGAQKYAMKDKYPSTGGTLGLQGRPKFSDLQMYDDKRGLDGLFEVMVTNVVGTNPLIEAWLLYETLEVT